MVVVEQFDSLNIEDINEIIVDKAQNEEEVLEIALGNEAQSVETDDSEIQSPITAKLILDGLQISK